MWDRTLLTRRRSIRRTLDTAASLSPPSSDTAAELASNIVEKRRGHGASNWRF
jgi:hypothetical protein